MAKLVGRNAELALFDRLCADAGERGQQLVLVGQPGIGKTAFLQAALSRAVFDSLLSATGAEFERDVGYTGLHQLLGAHLDTFHRVNDRNRDALTVALGLVEGVATTRQAVTTALIALIKALSQDGPVAVVVDDLHWLDRASAAVLSTVARNLPIGAFFLGAVREGHASFFDVGLLPQLPLLPLSGDDAARLLDEHSPGLTAASRGRILAEAQGNPLALRELPGVGTVSGASPSAARLPARLHGLFAPRIGDLPARTRELLLLAALESTPDLSVVLIAASPGVSVRDAAVAVRLRLVVVDELAATLHFTHPLIRSTVVTLASAAERREAHRALAERGRSQPEVRAHHLAEASPGPDEDVATALEDAAHVLLRRGDAPGAVADLLWAADLSTDSGGRGRRLAQAAYVGADVTGDLDRVADLLSSAGPGGGRPPRTLESATAAAYLLLNGDGDVDTSHRLLVAALNEATAEEDSDDAWVEAVFTLLWVCFFGGRADLWGPLTDQIERMGPGIPRKLSLCARTLGTPTRDGAEALEELRAAVGALGHEANPAEIALTARAAFYVDELAGCRSALWRVVTDGIDKGAHTSAISAWILLGFQSFLEGHWDDTLRFASRGLELCEARGYELLAWPGRYGLALVAAARGQAELSTDLCDAMMRWAQPRGVRSVMAYAHHVQALSALGRSDFEAAFRHASAVSTPGDIDPYLAHALWLMLDLVEAAVHTGRHDQALAHVEAMRAAGVDRLSSRLALILAHAEALVAPSETGAEMFARALATPDADRWTFELGRLQLAHGEFLRRARLPKRARVELQSARETFELLSASPWADRARMELAACSTQRRPGLRSDEPLLTPRELEVARLVSAGLTNPQVGTQLGISQRTVGAHLAHIMTKVGVRSRAALRDALPAVSNRDT